MAEDLKTPDRADLEHLGESIITIKGTNTCLGHLMDFKGHGVFDPSYGRVPVLPAEAEVHNRAFCDAQVKGLDENCDVGMCGTFYLTKKDNRWQVTTFLGDVVSDSVKKSGPYVTFSRKGKVFKGKVQPESDLLDFERIV